MIWDIFCSLSPCTVSPFAIICMGLAGGRDGMNWVKCSGLVLDAKRVDEGISHWDGQASYGEYVTAMATACDYYLD